MKTTRSRVAQYAKPTPTTPPSPASTMLSTSTCRVSRYRLAPSASRVPNSGCLAAARASSKFDVLAQAINNRISRKTGYKIYDRYKDCGVEGLTDRSRRPYRHANQLPMAVEKLIVALKREYPDWGGAEDS
jgi:hypothetical protein